MGSSAIPGTEPAPNILRQIAEFFILGRNYINVVAPEEESIREIVEQKYLFFFTWSRIVTDRGTHLVYAPEATLGHDFQVVPGCSLPARPDYRPRAQSIPVIRYSWTSSSIIS
jgi:hypothetical protein